MIKRSPAANGSFYPSQPNSLNELVKKLFSDFSADEINPAKSGKIKAILCPHAGYIYSGQIAACAYQKLAKDHSPKHILLIGPNHTGYGDLLSLYPESYWETPLGTVEVDNSWASSNLLEILSIDQDAHAFEHCLEVQLPFLQYLYGNNFKISALVISDQSIDTIKKVANMLEKENLPLIVATSDMTHYEKADIAKEKDSLLIESFKNKNIDKMYEQIVANKITACGPGPMAILAQLAKAKDFEIDILCYGTSGDTTNDNTSVVGYISATVKEK